MTTQVKICGLSTEATLEAALDAGADLVGFVLFPKSPRNVSVERAAGAFAEAQAEVEQGA
ncbi:MAG TPA: N-(5'-phosphoribosyl)anthranilate isomerase, partial [Hyphomicrobium zavarzinii]|nr:N-(5'-phosphoribosyl)anthranilate isomerase [Hyphomicrobium zavarzinii]